MRPRSATAGAVAPSALRLQRKCACEETGESCARCASKRRLQRKANHPTALTDVPPEVHDALSARGQPLDEATRGYMEPRFNQDFSHVRVHSDQAAGNSARAVNAKAYTVGRDIVFAPEQYSPGTNSGRELLAHELTHVLQQADGSGSSRTDTAMEAEANSAAQQVIGGAHAPPIAPGGTVQVARQPAETPPPIELIAPVSAGRVVISVDNEVNVVVVTTEGSRGLPPTEERRTKQSRTVAVSRLHKLTATRNEPAIARLAKRGYRVTVDERSVDYQTRITVAWGDPSTDAPERPAPAKALDTDTPKAEAQFAFSPGNLPAAATHEPGDLTGKMVDDDIARLEHDLKNAKGSTVETATMESRLAHLKTEKQKREGTVSSFTKHAREQADASLKKAGVVPQELAAATAINFTIGFVNGAAYEIAPNDWRLLVNEIQASPLTFQMGVSAGSIEGALEGIWDAVAGLVDFVKLGIKLSPAGLAARGVSELTDYIRDPDAYRKRMGENEAQIRGIASEFKKFLEAAARPEFLAQCGEELGQHVGREAGGWFSDTYMKKSTFEKGRTVGGAWGRMAIEIAMLFLGPEEWVARGAAAAGEAARASSKLRSAIVTLIEHFPALRKLYEARQLARAATAERSAATSVAKGEGLAGDALSAERKAAGIAGEAKGVLPAKTLRDGHTLNFTPEGCKVCSEPPCAFIRKKFARELDDNTRLAERLALAERNVLSGDKKLQADGQTVIEEIYYELERKAKEAAETGTKRVPTYLRDLDRLKRESKELESARRELAAAVQDRMPAGTKVKVVRTERTEAGMAQGRAASRPGAGVDPDIEYSIDLPDHLRKSANLSVPEQGAARARGTFKPDDIKFLGEKGEKYLFFDHKEVQTIWEQSYYSTEKARRGIRDMLLRHLDIARAMQPNCRGFAYTTNESKLANVIAEEIAIIRNSSPAAKDLLIAPGHAP